MKENKFAKKLIKAKAKLIVARDQLNEAIAAIPSMTLETSEMFGEEDPCAAERAARDAAFIVRNTANAALAAVTPVYDAAEVVAQTAESAYQASEQQLLDCESQ